MKCDKNFAMSGDSITVEGYIDNTRGNVVVENSKVTLEERRVVLCEYGNPRFRYDKSQLIGIIKKVNAGQTENFSFQTQIPTNLTSFTAIGKIVARYFVIKVSTEMGYLTEYPFAEMHIMINSKNPAMAQQKRSQPPMGWSPQ